MRSIRITVTGLVQGVGFRPFVAETAAALALSGFVQNAGGFVVIGAEGPEEKIGELIQVLRTNPPDGSRVDEITIEETEPGVFAPGFAITESAKATEAVRFLPPDLATCAACEKELFTPSDRRYRHPLISCTACGPRYSIMKAVPYDRDTITMGAFPLCPACEREYRAKGDRRRHAQTICCHDCGPVLTSMTTAGGLTGEAALQETVRRLQTGQIAAVKGVGGYHLCCLPTDTEALQRLRVFKNRERKPFALCFPNLDSIRTYAEVSESEAALLTSPVRPIVLLKKKKDFSPEVTAGSDRLGIMLPAHQLQMLLLKETGPLVMTSANAGKCPIITDEDGISALVEAGHADIALTHDREILTPLDDSIFQVVPLSDGEAVQCIRRSRGIVPEPVLLPESLPKPVFAAGGDLKNTVGFGQGRAVYVSQLFGDLEELAVVSVREKEIERMLTLFDLKAPGTAIGDLHPGYFSAEGCTVRVQHHHAHILSVMAEHGRKGPVLGLAFDGTGYGTDGTIWGSEFLLVHGKTFEKKASLLPVKLPGSDESMKNAVHTLTGYLHAAGTPLQGDAAALARALDAGVVGVLNSSMGRLFDAASALLGLCSTNSYEGECAVRLEEAAHRAKQATPLTLERIEQGGLYYGDGPGLILQLQKYKDQGIPAEFLALGFHRAVADFAVSTAAALAAETGTTQICLSGGSFVNRILLREIISGCKKNGLSVFWNEKMPPGDGGLCLGQAYYMMF